MEKKINLLFSVRDIASGYSIINLINFFKKKKIYNISVISTSPASKLLSSYLPKGISHTVTNEKYKNQNKYFKLLTKFIERKKCNFLITGLSGPGKSIDEALIFISKKKKIYSFSYQDFCGDINFGYGILPDCYLVTDKLSSKITKKISKKKTIIVGHLNYKNFSNLIFKKKKITNRILFCGQPLNFLQGYEKTIIELINAIKKQKKDCIFSYRPHPKEKKIFLKRLSRKIKKLDIDFSFSKEKFLYNDLYSSKYVISCYSSSIMDLSILKKNYNLKYPTSLCLLFNKDIKKYYKDYTRLNFLPYDRMKLTKTVYFKENLNRYVKQLLDNKFNISQFKSASTIFKSKNSSLEILNKYIMNKYDQNRNFYKE